MKYPEEVKAGGSRLLACIPVMIYMFSILHTTPAVILAIWLGIALLLDNILRPILLGRGLQTPVLVIFWEPLEALFMTG